MRKLASQIGFVRLLSAMIAFAIGLLAMPGLLTDSSSETAAKTLALTVHSSILIEGNAEFDNASGVVWGSGTASDPYIIEGWDIDASTACGIKINNTNAHFVVKSCYVHGGGSHFDGIALSFCYHGTLDGNCCTNNLVGVRLNSSNGNILSNNDCNSNLDAARLESSSYNTLSYNNCSDNRIGIRLISSNYNTLNHNNCSLNDDWGVSLESSSNNVVVDNLLSADFQSGISLQSSSYNTLDNNTCDSSYYYGIDLEAFSNDNTIVNCTCRSNYHDGIWLATSNSNMLRYNNCSSNVGCGITLFSGYNNEMTRNLILNNAEYGVNVSFCSNSRIWNNAIVDNNGAGTAYDPSRVQAFDNGSNNWWNSSGFFHGYGNRWSDLTTPDSDSDGIVDWSYNLTGNSGAKDYYPLTTISDTADPVTQAILGGDLHDEWHTGPCTLSFEATDDLSEVNWTTYSVDDGSWQFWNPYGEGVNLTGDGIHAVEYYSQDNAGNTECVRKTTCRIDTTAPSLVVDFVNNTKLTSSSVHIPWSSTDATSGVNHAEWSLDEGTWELCTGDSVNLTGLKDGVHKLEIRVKDNADNSVTQTVSFRVNTNVFSISGPVGPWLDISLILVALAVIVLLITVFRRRKQGSAQSEPEEEMKDTVS